MRLAGVLTLVLAAGELACVAAWHASADPGWHLLIGLTAVLLPYLWFICLDSSLTATLHALRDSACPPPRPACSMSAGWPAWWLAPTHSSDGPTRAFILAGCILAAGALQVGVQAVVLRRLGLRCADRKPPRQALGDKS